MSKISITPNASGTGVFTISSPATNTDRTLTLPDEAGTVLTSASSLASANLTGAVTVSGSNVGIGTSSPDKPLEVVATNTAMKISGAGVSSTGLLFETNGVERKQIGIPSGSSDLAFYSDAGSTEAMRIDSSGNLLVGTTSSSSSGDGLVLQNSATNGGRIYFTRINNTTSQFPVTFYTYSGTKVGEISNTSTSTSYVTSSDYRLKTDAQPMVGASDRVQALKPVNFEWISSGDRVDGFLAHEAQAIVPEAVTGTKDAMRDEEYEVTAAVLDADGRVVTEAVMGTRSVPDYQGIDQSKLVPLLTAALQEALTEISALKVRVAALEAV